MCFQHLRIRFRVPSRGSTSGKDATFHHRSRSRSPLLSFFFPRLSFPDSRRRTTLATARRCHCSPTLSVTDRKQFSSRKAERRILSRSKTQMVKASFPFLDISFYFPFLSFFFLFRNNSLSFSNLTEIVNP